MNTTLFAVGVLFFIFPAFVARSGHFTTSFYKFSRLARAERFLPFFANDWQIILIYALAYSTIIHFIYWRTLVWMLPESWPIFKNLLVSIASRADSSKDVIAPTAYTVCGNIYNFAPYYGGLLAFSYIGGKVLGMIRWNIIELYRKTVPNPWFYIIRPVGDDKITIVDVLTNVTRPSGNSILYRGIATEIISGRDGKPLSITISRAMRLEPGARKIIREVDYTPVSIPGEKFVILFGEIKNINVAQVVEIEPQTSFDRCLRCIKTQFEESQLLSALINLI